MENLYDKQNELYNIVTTLDSLQDDITAKYYKDVINEIKYEAQTELDEVEDAIYKQEKAEQKELEREYNNMRL